MTMVKMTIIKAVNVNQFRLFIVIIKNALQVSEIVIFIKPARGRTGPPGFSHAARRPSPLLGRNNKFLKTISQELQETRAKSTKKPRDA